MEQIKQIDLSDVPQLNLRLRYYDGEMAFADDIRALAKFKETLKVNFVAMVFCLSGRLRVKINSVTHNVAAGDALFVDSNCVVSDIGGSLNAKCMAIGLSTNMGMTFLNKRVFNTFLAMREEPVIHFTDEELQLMWRYYELARFKMRHPNEEYNRESMRAILSSYVLDLVVIVNKYRHSSTDSESILRQGDRIYRRFMILLAGDNGIQRSVSAYAALLCVTPKYLTSICGKHSGKTAGELITASMVNRIKQMLLYSDSSVKEIAMQLGFDNLSFFGKYVKKHLGASPNHYRKLNHYGR